MERDVDSISGMPLSRRSALRGLAGSSIAAAATTGTWRTVLAQDATPEADVDYPTIEFSAEDHAFLDLPAAFPGGFNRLVMTNQGPSDHHAMFMRINDGSTADEFMAALEAGDFKRLFALSTSLGGPGTVSPGQTSSVVVALRPGPYMVVCLIPDEETGLPHASMGMIAPLEMTEEVETLPSPPTVGTIELVDFDFEGLPSELPAEPRVLVVGNTGAQLHELVIFRLGPDVTYEDAESILVADSDGSPVASPVSSDSTDVEAEPTPDDGISAAIQTAFEATPVADQGDEPPLVAVAGTAPMAPGVGNFIELDLDAGDYVAVCFLPDPETGAPHIALGMIMPFTVV